MNEPASNALLKTLEEPEPTSYLILTTTNPSALLPTIRSRCQTIRFTPIPHEEIANFLIEQHGFPADDARLLARTSRGSLGRALATDIDTYRERRASMLDALKALTISGDCAELLRSAEKVAAEKDRDEYEHWLDVLETLIRDAWALRLGRPTQTIVNGDLL